MLGNLTCFVVYSHLLPSDVSSLESLTSYNHNLNITSHVGRLHHVYWLLFFALNILFSR